MMQNHPLTIKLESLKDLFYNFINVVNEIQIQAVYASNSMISSFFSGYYDKEGKKDQSVMNYSIGNTNTTKIYTSPLHNFTFSYPSEWKQEGDENNLFFYPSLKNNYETKEIRLLIKVSPWGHVPLTEHVSIQITNMKQNNTDFNILDSGIIYIDAISAYKLDDPILAYKLIYSYKENEKFYKVYQVWTIIEEKVYSIAFQAPTEYFDDYYPMIQGILDSMFIETKTTTDKKLDNGTIPGLKVAIDPHDIVFNPISNKLYVANFKFHTLSVIDNSTDKLIKEIKVGRFPEDLIVNPDLNVIYVANFGSNSISVIDGATNSLIENITVGDNPISLAIDNIEKNIKGLIFVAYSDSDSITVIDTTSNKILTNNIVVGKNPSSIALDPITNKLYVTNKGSDSVSVIDYFLSDDGKFHKVSNSTVLVRNYPLGIAINPDKNKIYVTNHYNNSVSVINGATKKVDTIKVETNPSSIAIDPKSNKIYVANYGSNSISVIDGSTNKVIYTINVGEFPRGLYYNQASQILYVMNTKSNTISQIHNNTLLVGITYNIYPPDSGNLSCNDVIISKNDYIKYEYGSNIKCIAESKSDYTFSSWLSSELLLNTDKKHLTTFTSNGYGNLTAKFQIPVELSFPKEYWDQLYVVVFTPMISIIIGMVLPAIFISLNSHRQRNVMKRYINQIMKSENNIEQGNEIKQNISELESIRLDIMKELAEGKISETQYEILDGKISEYIENFK